MNEKARLYVIMTLAGLAAALLAVCVKAGANAEGVKPYYRDNGYPWAVVNATQVNFRAGPGTEYRVRQQWSKGVAVEILGREGEWYKVRHWTSPEPMWVYAQYLTKAAVD